MAASTGTFEGELAWAIECLEEAQAALGRCHYWTGFEQRPPEIGRRLKDKTMAIGVQRDALREISEGKLG